MRCVYLLIRGITDRVIAAVGLIVLFPVLIMTGVVVRFSLGSPVLFRQERVGRYGRSFSIVKFRTMVPDAEKLGGGYMPEGLNLVPPVGRFLRKTSLDELPQLVNIVRGDIAFIGPRPALRSQFERYTPKQRLRVSVPQGLTGLAQVRHRNNAPWSVRIETDLEYIARLGPRLDFWILFTTLKQVLLCTGVRNDQSESEVDDLGPAHTTKGSAT